MKTHPGARGTLAAIFAAAVLAACGGGGGDDSGKTGQCAIESGPCVVVQPQPIGPAMTAPTPVPALTCQASGTCL